MKIYEIGTGYTSIPSKIGAATEIVVEELTRAFLTQNKDVNIIDIKADDREINNLPILEVNVPKFLRTTDVKLGIMHKVKRIVYSIKLAKYLKKILKNSDEKIILHFHNQYNMYFFLKMSSEKIRKKCILMYTNHSYIWHGEWSEIKSIVKKRYFQESYCMKHADFIFVLNERSQKNIISNLNIDKSKVFLINNGVNTKKYKPLSNNAKNEFKSFLHLDVESKVFIQVGSICDRKNQLGALKLLTPILKENSKYYYYFAGGIIDQEYFDELLKFAKEQNLLNQVKYLGELKPGEELNKYYNIAEAMVFPSKQEGFSLVIIEAMSAGVPVIINDDLQFILANKCIKYREESNFVSLINENIFNEKKHQEIKENIRQEVLSNYSWEYVANEYLKIIEPRKK